MRRIISAEATKVKALRTKTVSRPSTVATPPPSAEPTAMVAAVVEAEREFAARSSSVPPTRFGMEARLAALKNAETEKSDAPTKYMSASEEKRFAARKPSARDR